MANGVWKKSDILADINVMYIGVGTPLNPGGEGEINGVTKYIVNVNELAKGSAAEKPVGSRKNIVFYVFHEGQADEKAWYEREEPKIETAKGISTVSGNYCAIQKIFYDETLRKRIIGWILKQRAVILAEAVGTTNHVMRLKWADDMMKDPAKYGNAFMSYAAVHPTVQAVGNNLTDTQINSLAAYTDTIAAAYGFTN